jgi:CBS domain-containing protein
MFVQSVLKAWGRDIVTLTPTASVAEAAGLLSRQEVQIVMVCDDGRRILGVVTDSDILRRVGDCQGSRGACGAVVGDLMTRDVVKCRRSDTVESVIATMKARGLRRIPVVEADERAAGLITMRDALLYLYEEAKLDSAMLRDYFLGLGYH